MRAGEDAGTQSKWDEERFARKPERGEDKGEWVIRRSDPVAPKRVKGKAVREEPWQISDDAIKELQDRVPPKRAERLAKNLKDASRAYASERWGDARKSLRPLLVEVPDAPSVAELNAMLLYRTGQWARALKELAVARESTQSYDLLPAMMDSLRALGRHKKVEEMWVELKEASPGPDVMAEGRIVMAESLADRSQLAGAIRLLEDGPRPRQRVQQYHLRSWYALADLHDRAGDAGRARMFFEKVAAKDPDLADVLERLEGLD